MVVQYDGTHVVSTVDELPGVVAVFIVPAAALSAPLCLTRRTNYTFTTVTHTRKQCTFIFVSSGMVWYTSFYIALLSQMSLMR